MSVSPEFKAFVEEQLADLGPVAIRSMFGGGGVFHQGIMFGLIARETLYFKVDDSNRSDFEAEGMGPFTYEARGKTATMSYWEIPERLYDDRDALTDWARKAFAVAFSGAKGGRRKR